MRKLLVKSNVGVWGMAALIFCGACENGDESDGGVVDTETDTGLSCELDSELADGDADDLFDWPDVPTFDLYLPPETWEQLQIDARDEQYVEAKACFEGRGIGTVGMRFKGNVGSLYSCFNEKDENTCRKLGIKLKFNKYDKENRFFGLKRLNFQSNRYDETYMRETLAYDLYREMGIVAPRASFANLRVNDEPIGLFGMVEQIDGRFTADRWTENGDGNLYKEVWPINTDEAAVIEHLKTNDDEPDVSNFTSFSQAVIDSEPSTLRETLGEYIDLDYWAKYMVVDDAIANFDGVTAIYTDSDRTYFFNHNFYLYEEDATQYTIVPWDLESTFNTASFGYLPHWTEVPEDCSQTYSAWGDPNTVVIAPGCDIVFQALASDLSAYRTFGAEFLDDIFTEKQMIKRIDAYVDFIADSVDADPNGPGTSAFDSNVAILKNNLPVLIKRFEHLLAGEPIVPFEIDVERITDFEQLNDVSLIVGTGIYVNSTSLSDFSINDIDPIIGDQSLHIGFEFFDDADPFDQWLQYHVRIAGNAREFEPSEGIRFYFRADQSRTMRIELDSTVASSADNWLRPGWDIEIDEDIDEYEVRFADADFPWWIESQGVEPVSTVDDVLGSVTAIVFSPQPEGVGSNGYFPDGVTDEGYVEVDDIEFF